MSDLDDVLREVGAVDAEGNLRTDRFEGAKGQWFVMPIDRDGLPATFWTEPNEDDPIFSEDAFRDEQGRVLTGLVLLPAGMQSLTPLDASLRPLVQVSAITTPERKTISANPGGWPLTEEELDREQMPPPPEDWPQWRTEAYEKAAKDRLGRPFTTRLRAADGGWADALMDPIGRVVNVEAESSELGEPGGKPISVAVIRGPAGSAVPVPLHDGRPTRSREGLEQPDEEDKRGSSLGP